MATYSGEGSVRPEVPEGWSAHEDPKTGATYYVNNTTNQSQWTLPLLPPPPAPLAAPPPPSYAPSTNSAPAPYNPNYVAAPQNPNYSPAPRSSYGAAPTAPAPQTYGAQPGSNYAAVPTHANYGQPAHNTPCIPQPDANPEVRVTFQGSNKLGIQWEQSTVVGVVPGGQASNHGIQVGWQILTVAGEHNWLQTNALLTRSRNPGSFDVIFHRNLPPGHVQRTFNAAAPLGIQFAGAIITNVNMGSQASQAGVQVGWEMLSVNQVKYNDVELGNTTRRGGTYSMLFRTKTAAPSAQAQAVVVHQQAAQGRYHSVKYCGLGTWLISLFIFPICCCPIDTKQVWVPAGQPNPPDESCC